MENVMNHIKCFYKEILLEYEEFKQYLIQKKFYILIIFLFLLTTYGIKVFYYDTSIDTEFILNSYAEQMNAWKGVGRYSLVFLKEVLLLKPFNPIVANILTFAVNFLSAVVLSYFFHTLFSGGKRETYSWIFPVVFFASPIMAEQFAFILQSFEVALGILATFISLWMLIKWIQTNILGFFLFSILLNLFSFGLYQSFLPFFIAGVVVSVIALMKKESYRNSQSFKPMVMMILKYIIVFVISIIGYELIIKLSTEATGAYLNNQVCWGTDGQDCIKNIQDHALDIYKGNYIYYSKWLIWFFLVIILISTYSIYKRKENVWVSILLFCLLLTPILMAVVMGVAPVLRSQFCYPFVLGFMLNYVLCCVTFKPIRRILLILVTYISFNQAYVTSLLFYSDHMRYEEDLAITHQLGFEIDSIIQDQGEKRVVFIGSRTALNTSVSLKGETLGRSYYEWDASQPTGSSIRILGFMRNNGFHFKEPTSDDYQKGLEEAQNMSVWPGKQSIKVVDELIIVRMQ